MRYNEYRAIIDIQTGKVTGQMPRRALHLVFEWLDLHKDELMENWARMENGETLAKINPLDSAIWNRRMIRLRESKTSRLALPNVRIMAMMATF